MRAIELVLEDGFSLRKALSYSGCSRKMYYHKRIPRMISLDPVIVCDAPSGSRHANQ